MPIATETRIFRMYGSDAGQPPRSLYTKGLSPLCDSLPTLCITPMLLHNNYGSSNNYDSIIKKTKQAYNIEVCLVHGTSGVAATAMLSIDTSSTPRMILKYPSSPHSLPQLFFTLQYGTPASEPYPTTSTT